MYFLRQKKKKDIETRFKKWKIIHTVLSFDVNYLALI